MMKTAVLSRTAAAAALALACSAALAGQDPARVDGAYDHDPAAVSTAPPSHGTMRGGLSPADAWQSFGALAPRDGRHAGGGTGVPGRWEFPHPSSARGGRPGWLDQWLPPADADPRLQRGMRAAQEAMDGMGRQLMPALRDFQRDFDEGLQQAQSRQR